MNDPALKFVTARTLQLRQGKLNDYEQRTLDRIEKYGCSVLSVGSKDKERVDFTYTIGAYDTGCQAEFIAIGMIHETAHDLLNEAVEMSRLGVDLSTGRHAGLLGKVECEFRPVDRKWIKHVMNSANWYNGNSDYPVLQAVYPDLQNRFPGEEGFNEYFAQPLLQPDGPETRLEEDFWASNDPKSSLFNWKFPDSPHTGVVISTAVHEGKEEVNFVCRSHEDGDWQFLGDSMSDTGGVIVCFHHPIDKDPTLKELADLPIGWYAEREKPGASWIRRELPPEDPDNEKDAVETT